MFNSLAISIENSFQSPFSTSGGKTLADVVTLILNGALAIAGVVLLVILIGAGIAVIGSAGKGKSDDTAKAAKVATSALVGFLIVFGAFLLVQFLGKFLGGDVDLITVPK